jgi:TusA-related sulfurtransferase
MFLVLDLRGLNCPLPEPRTRKMLCLLAHGDCLIVEGTDPLAVIDIPHGLFIFHIKRGKA